MSRNAAQICRTLIAAIAASAFAATAMAQYVETNRGCISCHESPQSRSDFCDAVPASIWRQDDKHRRAFELLHESNSPDAAARAKKQALVRQILGFDLREAFLDDRYSQLIEPTSDEAKSRVVTVKACLRCHGTWPKEADEQFVSSPPVSLDLGVSCQACHGPGERWLAVHFSESWRRVTPDAKAALGYAECRSPFAKAKLCANCHVGNVAEEKFVKHEWYAAGHPPLPSFELASFEAQMPRHWKSLREKGPFKYRDAPSTGDEPLPLDQRLALERAGVPANAIKPSYLDANFADAIAKGLQPAADLAGAKDAIVGGAVTFSIYARSLADYAAYVADSKATWPELALYDCSACHHELRSGLGSNTRPKRNHIPGRPPLATWPEVLTRLAAGQADGYQAESASNRWSRIRDLAEKLDKAATGRPFGEPAAMASAASDLATALEHLALDASNTRFDEQAARAALQFLANTRNYESADFYTARQVAWAITAIASELQPGSGPALFLQNAGDPLALRLPSGPNQSVMDNLRRWLPAAGKYDPASFQQQLKSVPLR
jgi:hypothetical protein